MGTTVTGRGVVGRERELALVDGFLARAGEARALILTGGAGIGKTTLWEVGIGAARERGWRVLTARSSSAETQFAFGGLIDLFDGIGAAELSEVPVPQCAALEAATLRAEPSPSPTTTAHGSASLADGVHQIACQATDGADQGFHGQGNQGAGAGLCGRCDCPDRHDPPTVTYSGDAGSYGILANVAINCSAADTLSGVASTTCANQSGAAWSFGAGSHSLSATATDNAGNTGSGSASVTVTVSAADLDTLTHQFIHGAAPYTLPAFMKAIVDVQVSITDLVLRAIGPKTTASQKHAAIASYDASIQTLAREGWLTASQASTLIGLAAAL